MKKLILLLLLIPLVSFGQINSTDITIIQSSTQINIGWDGNFQDNIERQFDVLGLRQENYDRIWNIQNSAYSKVMKQDFISPINKRHIKEWKTQVEEWIKTYNLQGIDWSINENAADAFELYPNPAQNILNIDGNFESIEIYDIFGKLVFASDEKSEINIAGLANGSYYVNILTSNAVIKKKVTVAR